MRRNVGKADKDAGDDIEEISVSFVGQIDLAEVLFFDE